MRAEDVLEAMRVAWPGAALVPELTIYDEIEWTRSDADHESITRRIDALMFENLVRTAIEIKVSRADAARETWAKVRPWRLVSHRFLYATPAGLIDSPPIPGIGAGLVWIHDDGRVEWKRKCRVSRTPEPLPQRIVQTLAFRAAHSSAVNTFALRGDA
jgi:hypothetical protein